MGWDYYVFMRQPEWFVDEIINALKEENG